MVRMRTRTIAIAAVAATVLLGWRRGSDAPVPTASAAGAQVQQPVKLTQLYYGNDACGRNPGCHRSEKPAVKEDGDQLGGFSTLFARHHEEFLWNKSDRHKIATSVLTEKRGQRIAQLMGITGEIADPAANRQWRQCLSCHGVVIDDESKVHKATFGPKERIASGVSCVACHGPYAEWINEHYKIIDSTWKEYTREQKEQKFGLRDLWNPVKRAALCCSCHVGSAAEGKVVTHEMYAAGHPPLPSFEMVTYSAAMPRHWETMAEKYARLPQDKEIYDKVYHLGADSRQHEVQLVLTSAVVALRNSAQLIGDYAAKADKPGADKPGADKPGAGRDWPEFALYDCYACHHDLKSDSWRQQRGYAGKPGRPQMTEWPLALMPLAIAQQPPGAADEYHKKLAALQAAFSNTPFGEPVEVARAADALAAWSDVALRQIAQSRLDRDATGKLIAALVKHQQNALLDFDSARQVSWGLHVLLAESQPGALDQARVKAPFDRLREQLRLTLPERKQPLADEYVPAVAARRAEYDAVAFQRNLKALAEGLSAK